jgi:hypothetical protein
VIQVLAAEVCKNADSVDWPTAFMYIAMSIAGAFMVWVVCKYAI